MGYANLHYVCQNYFMKRYFYLLLVVFTTLLSCGHKNQILYIQFNQASDLRAETKVTVNGFPVGEITGLAFTDSTILATVVLIDSVRIPKQSRFVLEEVDLLGSRQVSVYLNQTRSGFILSGDTVAGEVMQQDTASVSDLASALDTTTLKNIRNKVTETIDSAIAKKRK